MRLAAVIGLFLLGGVLGMAQPPPAPARPFPPLQFEEGYLKLDFYYLSFFPFQEPDVDHTAKAQSTLPTGEEQIPPTVRSWSGKKVILTGFVVPTKMENGKATELMLMANLMLCCYGSIPKMNDWVIVKIPGGTPVIQDRPIVFRGTFKVGARYVDSYLTGIYELEAEGPGQLND